MTCVFADTYFFVALLNQKDEGHEKAVGFLKSHDGDIVTSEYVLVETADTFASSRRRVDVSRFIARVRQSQRYAVVPCDTSMLNRGLDIYAQRADKAWSLTDCTSFVVMDEQGLTEALTGDHHFQQAGFRILL